LRQCDPILAISSSEPRQCMEWRSRQRMATLRELREGRLLTQVQLANELGTTPGTIYRIESGRTRPRMTLMRTICSYFNVKPNEIEFPEPKKVAA
jgi:DNA-binding XRE family transcriptional regulator